MKKRFLLIGLILLVLFFGCVAPKSSLSDLQVAACDSAHENGNCDGLDGAGLVSASECCSSLGKCCSTPTGNVVQQTGLSDVQETACKSADSNNNCDKLSDLDIVTADECCSGIRACCSAVPIDEFKSVLIDAIRLYFSNNPASPSLSANEVKDLITAYFSSTGDAVDLSRTGSYSGERLVDIYNKAKGKPPAARCGDGICNEFETINPNLCWKDCTNGYTTSEDSPFGTSGAWSRPFFAEDPGPEEAIKVAAALKEPYKDAQGLGAKWLRAGIDLHWNQIQPGRDYVDSGTYNWELADNLYGRVPKGMNILANIRPTVQGIKEGTWEFLNQYAEDRYIQFVKKVVERYDGDGTDDMPGLLSPIKYWQVDNEQAFPPLKDGPKSYDWKGFSHLEEITYKAVKEADPQAKVAIGGIATGAPIDSADPNYQFWQKEQDFFFRVLEELKGKYLDIFDIHYYGSDNSWPDNWKDTKTIYATIRQELDRDNYKNAEIWFTETSIPSRPFGEKAQAIGLVKRYVYPLSFGAKKIFWYNMIEGEAPLNIEKPTDHYGLIFDGLGTIDERGTKDPGYGVKKLSYYAYKKMVEVLEGSDWNNIQQIRESGGIYIYKFTRQEKPIWVAWNDNAQGKTVTITGIASSQARVTEAVPSYESGKDVVDYDSAFSTDVRSVESGQLILPLGATPLYIEEVLLNNARCSFAGECLKCGNTCVPHAQWSSYCADPTVDFICGCVGGMCISGGTVTFTITNKMSVYKVGDTIPSTWSLPSYAYSSSSGCTVWWYVNGVPDNVGWAGYVACGDPGLNANGDAGTLTAAHCYGKTSVTTNTVKIIIKDSAGATLTQSGIEDYTIDCSPQPQPTPTPAPQPTPQPQPTPLPVNCNMQYLAGTSRVSVGVYGGQQCWSFDIPANAKGLLVQIIGRNDYSDAHMVWTFPDGRTYPKKEDEGWILGPGTRSVNMQLRSQSTFSPNIPDTYIPQGRHIMTITGTVDGFMSVGF